MNQQDPTYQQADYHFPTFVQAPTIPQGAYASTTPGTQAPTSQQIATYEHAPVLSQQAPHGLGPAWTRGEMERPEGEREMDGWTAAVYTLEQQARLGVDEEGNPISNAHQHAFMESQQFPTGGQQSSMVSQQGPMKNQQAAMLRPLGPPTRQQGPDANTTSKRNVNADAPFGAGKGGLKNAKKTVEQKLQMPHQKSKASSMLSCFPCFQEKTNSDKELFEQLDWLFKVADKDRSGALSYNELQQLFLQIGRPLSNADLQRLITHYDKDKNGVITRDEFVAISRKELQLMKEMHKYRHEFSKVDKNNCGRIDFGHMENIMNKMNHKLTDEEYWESYRNHVTEGVPYKTYVDNTKRSLHERIHHS